MDLSCYSDFFLYLCIRKNEYTHTTYSTIHASHDGVAACFSGEGSFC